MAETINQRVIKCRRLLNMTQTDVADRMGLKCSTYAQMERKGIISAERLLMIAEIFEVSPAYLLSGEEDSKYSASSLAESAEQNSENILKQPQPALPQKEVFVITKKEENLVKMIRNFSKPNYNRVIKLIETIFAEEKFKKNKQ